MDCHYRVVKRSWKSHEISSSIKGEISVLLPAHYSYLICQIYLVIPQVLCMVDRCAPDTSDSNLPETKNPCLNKATPFLSPQCQSVEFTNLSPHTRHLLYLDVYLEGMDRAIRSRPLVAEVTKRPSTPKLRCFLPALEERKRLDAEACQLIDNQDR